MNLSSPTTTIPLTQTDAWRALQQHYQGLCKQPMSALFSADKQRFGRFSLQAAGILLDYSKNRITSETMELLLALAQDRQLEPARSDLFAGVAVNQSEQRPALHMALRYQGDAPMPSVAGNVMPLVQQTLAQMTQIVSAIRKQKFLGYNNEPIDTIVNIGIGGSDLGPQLLLSALQPFVKQDLKYHFLSTHDQWQVFNTLAQLNPATTVLIIASKSFTTEETLVNARLAKQWQLAAAPNLAAVQRHWIAVTTEPQRALAFDILPEHILSFWDWVGGRYSIWSAVGLVAAIALGMPEFQQFLAGGYAMDQHFQSATLAQNMPVILALLDIWYQQFFNLGTRALIPYGQHLSLFSNYMQQLHMESLGKRVTQNGGSIDYNSGNVIWGGVGTNSQHSFHQLLLQGTQTIPVDFIFALSPPDSGIDDNDLLSHCIAQSQVLLQGYQPEQIRSQYQSQAVSAETVSRLEPHQLIPGNVPSNTLMLPDLSPYRLGALMALYEHKVFAYATILGINPFDQWGVERGKHIAKQIRKSLHDNSDLSCYDASTQGLLEWVAKQR